jgi:hypothetical protein
MNNLSLITNNCWQSAKHSIRQPRIGLPLPTDFVETVVASLAAASFAATQLDLHSRSKQQTTAARNHWQMVDYR